MKKARYYKPLQDSKALCELCPHLCKIAEGKTGICKVRKNEEGTLYSANYGRICSMHTDPIEKKPLYHFFPGRNILSAGSIGCNLRCRFCQNWEISQSDVEDFSLTGIVSPGEIVSKAKSQQDNIGIAYTYNEPTVWYEFMYDTAVQAHEEGLKNVMVTNGFITPEPLRDLIPFMDAFNVDLKGFSDSFYRSFTSSKLEPVLDSLKTIREEGRHLEVTHLLIPETNDDIALFEKMIRWIVQNLGRETVLHLSRYFPSYRMSTGPTPVATLREFYESARQELDYVYIGNVIDSEGQNTECRKCGSAVIQRMRYMTKLTGLNENGTCSHCGEQIISENAI